MESLFLKHITRDYIEKNGITNIQDAVEVVNVIQYAVKGNLIPKKVRRHYTIVKEFERMSQEHTTLSKTKIIKCMAENLDVHENTIWNVLKDHSDKYQRSVVDLLDAI
ncbi:MAG: hypothetical protein AAFW00_10135 [Bacteroidota bacterium]